ncbi:MAG TPA: BrnT family toxin [Thermoanaerobaculia bacterium]
MEDERALTEPDDTTPEERFRTLGMDFLGRLVVVVYTCRGEDIRLISARKAKPTQRASYERKRP